MGGVQCLNIFKLLVSIVLIFLPSVHGIFPFRNKSLAWDERVNDIVNRLSLEELQNQLARGGNGAQGGPAPAIPRLGIGPYQWNEECLRGVAFVTNATAFPHSIGLAAAFNPKLTFNVAEAIGVEVRAKHTHYVKNNNYGDHTGLSCFSPVINIMRHPLWGRNQETYGEDPYLSGLYAEHYIKGLQGDHPRFVRASAGCKRFAVHGGPENIPVSRFNFDAKVSVRDMRLTYLPAFRACVDAGTFSLMCSFNKLNGVPACANQNLLTNILREEWGFKGYVVSDMGALNNMINKQFFFNTSIETAAAAIKAGCNLELSWYEDEIIYDSIGAAVQKGLLSTDLLRERVKPLFHTRMRLGEFDPPDENPYTRYSLSVIQSKMHTDLAVKAAMQSFVLLKNDYRVLPIKKSLRSIAFIGPMADNLEQLYGDYSPEVDPRYASTPLQGLKSMSHTIHYASGCNSNLCDVYNYLDILDAVSGAELVIICVGTGQETEMEGKDRLNMDLPGNQSKLILDALDGANGSKVILLIFSGGPVNISQQARDPRVSAIIQCFLPAQATGEALFNVLTMATKDASPSGRLPYTWYDTSDQIPSMTEYTMTERTYRYFNGNPLYPFGYGLSYSTFEYKKLTVVDSVKQGDDVVLSCEIKNSGEYDAYEVIQVYISWLTTKEEMPRIQLVGVNKVFIVAGTTDRVTFVIQSRQLAVWTDNGFIIEPGKIQVYIGGQQPNQSRNVGSNVLQATFDIVDITSHAHFIRHSYAVLIILLQCLSMNCS